MSKLVVTDNSTSELSQKKDYDNLSFISNQEIGDLVKENPNLLVFPPSVLETKDRIKKEVILTTKRKKQEYSLTTNNIMGFIGCKGTELNICSRFTNEKNGSPDDSKDFFLHYMLEKVCHVNLFNLPHEKERDTLFDFLPFLFPFYLNQALRQGIYKEYQTHEYNDANVRGTVEVNRHIRFNIPTNGKIAYKTREYSYDNSVTELVRHTLEFLRASKEFKGVLVKDEETKASVKKIEEVTRFYNQRERNKIISQNNRSIKSPYFTNYRDLQKICRMILLHEKIKYDNSKDEVYGILFDGAWLWEEYLAITLIEMGYKHPQNKTGGGDHIYLFQGNHYIRYPDFYKSDVVLDAKYKFLKDKNFQRDDIHQLISYMHVLPVERGGFIYPISDGGNSVIQEEKGELKGKAGSVFTIGFPCKHKVKNYPEYVECMERVIKTLKKITVEKGV